VLCKKRCGRNRLLTGSIAISGLTSTRVRTRDILLTDVVTIHNSINHITHMKFNGRVTVCVAVVETRDGQYQTIGAVTPQPNGGNISLDRVDKTSHIVTRIVLTAEEVVLFSELDRDLSI
jgi:hypothetical protein